MSGMIAIEGKTAGRKAAKAWFRGFKSGAEDIGRFLEPVLWHEDVGIWGVFMLDDARGWRPDSYLTYFGHRPVNAKQNVTVQVNPPTEGRNSNLQGVFATDKGGSRWVLHQGRLHPGGARITQDMFASVAPASLKIMVRFKDGHIAPYYRVANIDASREVMRKQLANFVYLCEQVRTYYVFGPSAADDMAGLDEFEEELYPETGGEFQVPARKAGKGFRWHTPAFEALTAALKARNLQLANRRVGRHGPDLYTRCAVPKLFEIKTSARPVDIQQALGQLRLYEKLLKVPHKKVIVLPEPVHSVLGPCLEALDVQVLTFKYSGRAVLIDPHALDKILG